MQDKVSQQPTGLLEHRIPATRRSKARYWLLALLMLGVATWAGLGIATWFAGSSQLRV